MGSKDDAGDKAIAAALTKLSPLAHQLGFSGMMGGFSGYAAKKIGKVIGATALRLPSRTTQDRR